MCRCLCEWRKNEWGRLSVCFFVLTIQQKNNFSTFKHRIKDNFISQRRNSHFFSPNLWKIQRNGNTGKQTFELPVFLRKKKTLILYFPLFKFVTENNIWLLQCYECVLTHIFIVVNTTFTHIHQNCFFN